MQAHQSVDPMQYVIDQSNKLFDLLRGRLDSIATNMKDGFEKCDNRIEGNINRLESKVDTNFKWIVGMMITLFVLNGFVPVISKTFTNLMVG